MRKTLIARISRLPFLLAYSKMLYMKTRVTFRVAPELADALRGLPNQTEFVENALRDALGVSCPACDGKGRISGHVRIQDVRAGGLRRFDRATALQVRNVVRLARRVAATEVRLEKPRSGAGLAFEVRREANVLFAGRVEHGATIMTVH
jgi:hypothetical protein